VDQSEPRNWSHNTFKTQHFSFSKQQKILEAKQCDKNPRHNQREIYQFAKRTSTSSMKGIELNLEALEFSKQSSIDCPLQIIMNSKWLV